MKQQAVILAAGNGKRLAAVSGGLPKGLLRIGPCTLLEHQLRALRVLGIDRVCMVVGFGAEHIEAAFGHCCEFVYNERYSQTNSLYSLWLARHWVQGPFVLMNCDVLAHPYVIARVACAQGSALAFDSRSGQDDEHMKVDVDAGRLRAIGKCLPAHQRSGENVGVLRFDAQAARSLFEAAGQIVASGDEKAWAPAAVGHIAGSTPISAVDVCDLPWCEIDFPEDLGYATSRVWPAIRADGASPRHDPAYFEREKEPGPGVLPSVVIGHGASAGYAGAMAPGAPVLSPSAPEA